MVDSISSIDLDFLLTQFGDDPGFIAEILQDFICSMDDALSRLQSAVDRDDYDMVVAESHQLKASSRTVGANALSDMAVKMETFARDHEGDLPHQLEGMLNQSEKVRLAVRAYCSTQQSLH